MVVLTDGEILKLVKSKKLMEPFCEKQLTPNGYDVAIAKIEVNGVDAVPNSDGNLVIPAGALFVVLTKEWINMPPKLMGFLAIKTKFARMGVDLRPGFVDAGFKGNLNLCCQNTNGTFIEIKDGAPFVQIAFEKLGRIPLKLYAQRSGHYQNQNKVMK
jgi:deoxycytidine triphosphate deaminase